MAGDARQIASPADDSANSRSLFVLWRFSSEVVGATGFEPATPCAQGRCATRLRYAPTPDFDCTAVFDRRSDGSGPWLSGYKASVTSAKPHSSTSAEESVVAAQTRCSSALAPQITKRAVRAEVFVSSRLVRSQSRPTPRRDRPRFDVVARASAAAARVSPTWTEPRRQPR